MTRSGVYSIEQNRDPARVYEIYLMKDLAGFDRRGWTTGFTNYRFTVPHLAGCEGRAIVPYGLYLTRGAFNPFLADDTEASEEDLALLWDALANLWDLDRSVSRGTMTCRGLYVFTHNNKAGDAPAHSLYDRVTATLQKPPPRRFEDYQVGVNDGDLPPGIALTRLVG